jgi:hypothetical protein
VADLDPRLHAWRPDLADIALKGRVEAARFVEGTPRRVVAGVAPLKCAPRFDAPLASEVIRVFRCRWREGKLHVCVAARSVANVLDAAITESNALELGQ